MRFNIQLDESHLIESLSEDLSRDELVDFVKKLDDQQQDWDFTEKLYEHFALLHQDFLKESAEDEAKRAAEERCPRAAGSSCVGEREPYSGPRCMRCDRLNP